MKIVIAAVILALGALASAEDLSIPHHTAYDYHRKVGIPKASAVKFAEEQAIKSPSRIIAGSVTDVKDVPYQVGLLIRMLWIFQSACGGSLVSANRVITAAHCYTDGLLTAQSFEVILGSNYLFSGGVRYTTTDCTVHPDWNPVIAANDIAVITIPTVEFTESIQPIALPSGDEENNSFVGVQALASGFGLTADGSSIGVNQQISSVTLDVVDNSVCRAIYGIATADSNVCTTGQNGAAVCSGDSGGPLAVESNGRRILIGVTSYGHSAGCEKEYPNAFSRITSFLSWYYSI